MVMAFQRSKIVLPAFYRRIRRTALVVVLCALAFHSVDLWAQNRRAGGTKDSQSAQPLEPRDYRSRNFVMHSDLDPQEAADLLKRLEKMLSLISRYWGRPNRQPIECYVVKDLNNWPERSLHPLGREKVAERAGVTVTRTLTQGNRFLAKAIVYAIAERGTPQHEAVHAYCGQVFGRTGPTWYSEGMAEMGHYWKDGDRSVNCDPLIVEYLRRSRPMSLNEIVNGRSGSGDSWQNYAWRWALCHLLANNSNYADRFRPLGLALLTGQNVSFEQVYGSMAREISFEYLFFLKHLERGYRVDLCSWNWKGKFRTPRVGTGTLVKVKANAGWQTSRILVRKDDAYEYTSTGDWQVETDGEALTADGDSNGVGKLVGIVLDDDYELSEPFELGVEGAFTVPTDGRLFLRCRDKWSSLADNQGRVTVRIKVATP